MILWKITWDYKCNSLLLAPYFNVSVHLLDPFDSVEFEQVLRESHCKANELALVVSGVKMGEEYTHKLIVIEKKNHLSIFERGINLDIFNKYEHC